MPKPGPRPFSGEFSEKIAALRVSKQVYFKDASADSIKSIACRAGKILDRQFSTRKENGGVWVYREA